MPSLNHLPLDTYAITPRCVGSPTLSSSLGLSRWLKTQINAYSPYDETLFLDADILPLDDLSSLWPYVDAIAHIPLLDRHACRQQAEAQYSLPAMGKRFEQWFFDILAAQGG
ncbi:MAG: hypothetical protein ACFCVB_02860 [Nodosilinea sp.]